MEATFEFKKTDSYKLPVELIQEIVKATIAQMQPPEPKTPTHVEFLKLIRPKTCFRKDIASMLHTEGVWTGNGEQAIKAKLDELILKEKISPVNVQGNEFWTDEIIKAYNDGLFSFE